MSKLIEGLARRLGEQETVSRRGLLTGRRSVASAAVVAPLVGSASAAADHHPQALVAARSSKAPPLPARSDLRAIHISVMSSEARLKSDFRMLVDALTTPAIDGTFSSAANEVLARTHKTVRKLRTSIAKVQPGSSERSQMLSCLTLYQEMLTDLEQLGQNTDPTRAATLTAKIKKLGKKAEADYDACHAALGLPKATT